MSRISSRLPAIVFLHSCLCWTLIPVAVVASVATATAGRPPNVVVILVDDLGQRDLGCYGSTFYETPAVDRLAAGGSRFTDAYAACQVCSPTRASLMIGQWPQRVGITDYIGAPRWPDLWKRNTLSLPAPYHDQLPRETTTLAEAMRAAGYATFFAGKWHLGPEGCWPEDHGFDENHGGVDLGGPSTGGKYFSPYANPRLADGPDGEHLPDRLANETIRFIGANRDKPFLVYLSFYSVHTPLMARPDLREKYEAKKARLGLRDARGREGFSDLRLNQSHAVFAGMVEAMDQAVDKVVREIDALGLGEDTLIVFTSDNGGLSTAEGWPTSNAPLRAGKGWIHEGGIRVPLIVRWPGRVPAGSVCTRPVSSPDFMPTLLEAAGIPPPAGQTCDGISFLPALAGNPMPERPLFWHYPHYGNQGGAPSAAIRLGRWKLIEWLEDGRTELFDLEMDIGETTDLSRQEPEQVGKLRQMLDDWQKEVGAKFPAENPAYDPAKPNGRTTSMPPACADGALRSPENQVYQFMATRSFGFRGGKTRQATAYLWIPPACRKPRGLLVACRNVTEHWLTGHPAIRDVCEKENLALLWSCPSFYPGMDASDDSRELVAFLKEILAELAATSGYPELAEVPWLPMGESSHLQMVKRLVDAAPEQCIAAIQIKNGRMDIGQGTRVPVLTTIGTCYEWDQEKADLLTQWKTFQDDAAHQKRRMLEPDWPGSLMIEGGSGHFECTEPMAMAIAGYISAAVRARLPDGEIHPRPVDLRAGWVAGLGLPGGVDFPPKPFADATPEERSQPWFFTRELAEQARAMARINWDASTQVPVFADAAGKPLPFGYRSIFSPLPYTTEEDGITFRLHAGFLDVMPPGFVHAGTRLGHSSAGAPRIDWICGPVAPLGGNRFRIALDRSWPDSPVFLAVWHPGDANFRHSVQPGEIKLLPNTTGKPQTITFALPAELSAGTTGLPLHASSDQGLPVRFFVRVGPARIDGDKLIFTPIPVRAKFPVAVTVVAWQWGRRGADPVQTAPMVERTMMLTESSASGHQPAPARGHQRGSTLR